MSGPPDASAGSGQRDWWLDSGLARLAFGSRAARDGAPAGTSTLHLAFLPNDALALDLSDPARREFGEYELLEQIGQGGMGVVYRARQKRLERDVALKLLSAGPWASEDFIAAFQREARNAASLQHPNIVSVYEMGEHDGLIFYAMRLVIGESLAQRLDRQRRLPVREAATLVRTVAEAVDYAHRLGVLHLDIKPGNILLDEHGVAQVTDFGLARRLGQAASLENEQVSGTPSYMAPEQAQVRDARLSAATDIWGLGAVLYELCTGRPPFVGDSPRAILDQVLTCEVRSPARFAPVPRDLEAICMKCLARPAADRYASARELADDLGRFLQDRSVLARPLTAVQRLGRWTRREPKLALTSGAAVLALASGLAAATWQWQRADTAAAGARAQTWQTRGEAAWRLVDEGRYVDALPLLVDNLRERERSGDRTGVALERQRLGSLRRSGAQLIDAFATGARVGRAVDVDRAGERVAVVDMDDEIRLFSVAEGRLLWQSSTRHGARMRAMAMPPTRVEFSADGRYLVTATMEPGSFLRPHGRNNVLLDSADGRVVVPPPDAFADLLDATFSSDGSHAVLRTRSGDAQFYSVADWTAKTPTRRFPSLGGSWCVGDQGRYVARASPEGLALELLATTDLEPRHTFEFEPARGLAVWAAQPDGELLALGHNDGGVQVLDTTGGTLRTLWPPADSAIRVIRFSHDGRWVLAASGNRVHVWDAATGRGGALPMDRGVEAWRVEGDAHTGTVFVVGVDGNATQLWQVPDAGIESDDLPHRLAAARPRVSQFGFGASAPRNAAAYAPAAGLVVNIERDGEMRLWRWHEGRTLGGRGAALAPDDLAFDGEHVAVVEGRVVHMVQVDGERIVSPAMIHPQEVSLASPLPDGAGLLTVSGRELRVFDWRSGALRWPPLVLVDSPLRVVPSPDSSRLVVTTAGYRDGRFQELASSVELGSGRVLTESMALPGPLDGLRFDREGRRVVHWRGEQAQIREAVTLRPVGPPARFGPDVVAFFRNAGGLILDATALNELSPIIDAGFDGAKGRLTVIVSGSELRRSRLVKLDIGSGQTLNEQTLPPGMIPRLWPQGAGHQLLVLNALLRRVHLVDDEGRVRLLPAARAEPRFAQAISSDGRWLAMHASDGVLVLDRHSGEWASGLLPIPRTLAGEVAQLAFAPDGRRLLARSETGQWAWWSLAPDERSSEALARRVSHLRPGLALAGQGGGTALTVEERAALRDEDPGGPTAAPAPLRLAPPASARPDDQAGDLTIDLGPAITHPPGPGTPLRFGMLGPLELPAGRQRFHGIDYDLHGVVLLAMPETPRRGLDLRKESQRVVPSRPHFAAVHVLIGGCCALPMHADGPYAYLILHYHDGGQARVPVVHGRDMLPVEFNAGDSDVPRIAWVDARPRAQGRGQRLYAARLANPHPGRAVAGLVFEASEHFASGPAIFAATLEVAGEEPEEGS